MSTRPAGFEPYVPALLRESLLRNPDKLGKPFAERLPGALLFADLTGFTDLSERLAEDRARGPEDVQRILNRHFGRLLDIVGDWGGSVLKFAGDATIAFWTADVDQDLSTAAGRAVGCGIDIQAATNDVVVEGDITLRQRLVVGAGEARLAHVGGGDGKWEFVAAGDPWRQVAVALAVASPGEVVMAPEAWSCVEAFTEGREVGDGCHAAIRCNVGRPAEDAGARAARLSEDALGLYLSRSIKAQVEAGHREWLAEFRRGTVLFVQLPGFDFANPDGLESLQAATEAIQRALEPRGGHVIQFMVDDKGLVLLAAWGLAMGSHEDDAERAIKATQELHHELGELGLSANGGITTGKIFAGLLGNDDHLEYAIIGDSVNASARLMQAAQGGILCDAATRDAALGRFDFRSAGRLRVKGKSEPIDAFHPLGEKARSLTDHRRLIGRLEERAFLEQVLARTHEQQPTPLVHVVAEAGVGKSSLADFLVREAAARRIACVVGSADGLHRSDAYFAWRSVFERVLAITPSSTPEDVAAALADHGGPAERAPLLNAVLPVSTPETPFTESLDSAGRAESTRELLAQIGSAAARRTAGFLLFEDAHWFDSASWQLLETVRRRAPAVPIVVLSRPLEMDELPIEAQRLFEPGAAERLELGPLSSDESRALVADRLGVESVSDDLADRVFERAEGHPLFTEELVLSLEQQEGILYIENTATLTRDQGRLRALVFPDGIEAAVASRIDDLGPAEQLSLKVASVLGRSFSLSALASVRPIELAEAELAMQLESIRESRLVERGDDGDAYRFRHAIFQNTVHDLLTSEQQAQLHRAAAEWHERGDAAPIARRYAVLAHHWGLAGVDAKAVDYLELAAHQARDEHANREVIQFLAEAQERTARVPGQIAERRRAGWDLLLGRAEVNVGLYRRAEEHLIRSVGVLDRPQPDGGPATLVALLRELAWHARLRTLANRGAPPEREAALSAASGYAALSMVHWNNHENARTLYETLAGANLAIRTGVDSTVLARIFANLSVVSVQLPAFDPDYYAESAVEMAERISDPAALCEVLMLVGTFESGAARWAQAIEHYERSVAVSRSVGERRFLEMSLGGLGNIHRLRGHFRRADEADREVLNSGFDRNVAQVQVWGFYGRSCTLSTLNRFDELAELLAAFRRLLDAPGTRDEVSASNVVIYLVNAALLSLREGDTEQALGCVAEAVELVDALESLQVYMACTVSYLQDALMALWRRLPGDPRLRAWSRQADRFASRCGRLFPAAVARAAIGEGHRAARRGKPARAARAWREALEHGTRLDVPFDRAQAHHALSRCEALDRAERADHAAACARLLDELELDEPFSWTV